MRDSLPLYLQGTNKSPVPPTAPSYSSSSVTSSEIPRLRIFRRRCWKIYPVCGDRYQSLLDSRTRRFTTTLTFSSTDFRTRAISQSSLWRRPRIWDCDSEKDIGTLRRMPSGESFRKTESSCPNTTGEFQQTDMRIMPRASGTKLLTIKT